MIDDDVDGYATPEEAARGDIPEKFVTVLGVAVRGDEATVWLLTNDRPPFEAYVENCVRTDGRWHPSEGSGGFGAGASTPWEIREAAARIEEQFRSDHE